MMTNANQNDRERLAGTIKRLSSQAENRRFLHALPHFSVEATLPEQLRTLMAQLDAVVPARPKTSGRK